MFASLRAHDLEPLVTVNHFTLPAWVNDPTTTRVLAQLGLPAPTAGWLSPGTPAEFEKYAAYVAWKYGDQVDNWTVLNEPVPPVLTQYLSIPGVVPSWPPGVIRPDLASTFLVNEAKGYVGAYDAITPVGHHGICQATPGQPGGIRRLRQQHDPGPARQPGEPTRRAGRRRVERLLQQLVPERGDRRVGGRQPGRDQDRPTRSTPTS